MRAIAELFDLSGRVALVTGASSGIGWEVAQALSGAGADLLLMARRRPALEQNAEILRGKGARAAAVAADVADRATIAQVTREAAAVFGPPQILVNAAGINPRQPADTLLLEDWDRTLAVNLSAPFLLSRILIPAMRERGWGRVINIASLQSVRAFEHGIAYGASKGGVVQLTRAMAEAWSRDGINCNAIAPGFFPTELTAPLFADRVTVERLAAQTMIGRNGRLEDLHGIAVFLAAPASDYITGQIIFVDGGFTAR